MVSGHGGDRTYSDQTTSTISMGARMLEAGAQLTMSYIHATRPKRAPEPRHYVRERKNDSEREVARRMNMPSLGTDLIAEDLGMDAQDPMVRDTLTC